MGLSKNAVLNPALYSPGFGTEYMSTEGRSRVVLDSRLMGRLGIVEPIAAVKIPGNIT